MTPLSCEQVEQQLELFVLDEVSEPERSAVRAHVAGCRNCSRSLEEARRLLGLLDLHFNEAEQLARLRNRLEIEERPRVLPFRRPHSFRRLASLAALLLLAVGLTGPTVERIRSVVGMMKMEAMPGRVAPMVTLTQKNDRGTLGNPIVLTGGAVVQPTTNAVWQQLPGNQVYLKSGSLRVRVGPLGVQPVAILTPAGRAVALSADFTVTVHPGPALSVQTNSGFVRLHKSP